LDKEAKGKIEDWVTALRDKLSPEEFYEFISSLLDMPEEDFDQLLKKAEITEETIHLI